MKNHTSCKFYSTVKLNTLFKCIELETVKLCTLNWKQSGGITIGTIVKRDLFACATPTIAQVLKCLKEADKDYWVEHQCYFVLKGGSQDHSWSWKDLKRRLDWKKAFPMVWAFLPMQPAQIGNNMVRRRRRLKYTFYLQTLNSFSSFQTCMQDTKHK